MSETRRATFAAVIVGLAPLVVAGCGDLDRGVLGDLRRDRNDDDDRRTVEYRCDDDRRFAVRFSRDEAEVRAGDRRYRLDLEDRDGRRRQYGEGDVQLLVDGDEARLRIKDEPDYSDCEAR